MFNKIGVILAISFIYASLLISACSDDPAKDSTETGTNETETPTNNVAADAGVSAETDTTPVDTEVNSTEPVFELCEDHDTVDVLGGEYQVRNNVWGRDESVGDQCIRVQGTSFEVISSTHGATTNVSSYPSIIKGCHFGECTVDSGMPIRVSDVTSATFSWDISVEGVYDQFNAAYESWFSLEGGGDPVTELMIWINYYAAANPKGEQVDTVEINGHQWEVWTDVNWCRYIAYRIVERVEHVNIDLIPFMDDAIARGFLDPTDYLDDMEAGFEIWWLGKGLKSKNFVGHVE